MYDLLRNRDKDTVVAALEAMKRAGGAPKGFAMDMHDAYQAAVREVFPQAEIVVDKFHVTQQIDAAFGRVRTRLQAGRRALRKDSRPKVARRNAVRWCQQSNRARTPAKRRRCKLAGHDAPIPS